MKVRSNVIIAGVAFFGLSQLTQAQCPQICDSNENTALGDSALASNTIGSFNIAIGFEALFSNTTGISNTATGHQALFLNTTGVNNTATGFSALLFNTTGNENTAIGKEALGGNGTGSNNTALGSQALQFNNTGTFNTGIGLQAILFNTSGINNTATGGNALLDNTSGSNNTANGFESLFNNTIGRFNTAVGESALFNNTTGNHNIALGDSAGTNLTTGSNNIDIGNAGVAGESRTIRIGTRSAHRATFIAGISGATVAGGVGVVIDASGRLGTIVSSERYKKDIVPMDKASETLLALQPVSFRYKKELDPQGIPQFGLVAEQVEKVNPDLVARDEQGKPYTVRYEAINAMLLNEFLKAHHQIEEQGRENLAQNRHAQEQDATITELRSLVAEQEKQIHALSSSLKEQAAAIQTVARLKRAELEGPAAQLAANSH